MNRQRPQLRDQNHPDDPIQTAHQELEYRVEQRTAQLQRTIDALKEQIEEIRRTEDIRSRFDRILDTSSSEIYVFNADSMLFTQINQGAARNLGYSIEEMEQLTPLDLKPDFTPKMFSELLRPLREGKKEQVLFETRHRRKDGTLYPVEVRLQLSCNESPPVFVAIIQDISARKESEMEMGKLSRALEQTADSVIITDHHGTIEYVNPAFEETTGFARSEAVGEKPNIINSGKHDTAFFQKLWDAISTGQVYRDIIINKKKSGVLYYEEKTITPLKDTQGNITHFISTGKDITERMQAQERLHYLAHHDPVTALPNRLLFTDRLDHALSRNRRTNQLLVGVLFLDLDRFKNINDSLGHDVGDRLLLAVAKRLISCVREEDTVARLGGDEFNILIEDAASSETMAIVARKIIDALGSPFILDGRDLFITSSIGISIYPHDGTDTRTLLKNADIAMYRAKDLGRNSYQFYSSDMSDRAFERLALETSLRYALERNEFIIYYQPLVNVKTGLTIGMEALLRWQHPALGLVPPSDFIPLLEDTGLIVPVGEWVLHTACAKAAEWQQQTSNPVRLSVNLSARQFNEMGLPNLIKHVLDETGLKTTSLELEITESVIMRNAQATVETLNALCSMGVRLAIDDFGTGYSSLSYLKRFPINTLKIDRTFVRDISTDANDAAIVKTIVAMAHNLKLDVVAEGVETTEQMEFLRACHCDTVQGYLINQPVPAQESNNFFRR